MQITDKVVVVTGGGGGIGAGIAEAFAEKGAKVVVTDINGAWAEAEAARIGNGVIGLQHDVAALDSWASVIATVEQQCGAIDVLCNNAGISLPFKPLEDVSPAEFARVMAINVTGVYNGCCSVIPVMKARKSGHIVNTSSVNGQLPHATFAAYCASKFAVAGLSEAIRMELAPFGVGVSILYPGLTRSRMSEQQMDDLPEEIKIAIAGKMMEPIWLGRAVVRAVEKNRQHVITHPDHREALETRIAALLADFGEPAQPEFIGGRTRD